MRLRGPRWLQTFGGKGINWIAMTAMQTIARISSCRAGSGSGSAPLSIAAQAMIATPASCRTMFCQMPCALPPRMRHASR